ncbi:MAG: hypothetical protein WAK93_17810 [Solirubrobacteraceae bacterium]
MPERQLRPLGIGEVLDAAIKVYSRNALAMWKLVLAVIVPLAVIQEIVIGISLPHGAFVHHGTLYTPNGQLSTPALGAIVEIVLGILGPLIVNAALVLFVVDAYIDHPLDWGKSLRAAAGRLGSLLWLAILNGVLVVLALILLIIPGIWLSIAWCVSMPALMFEHVGGVPALRRSFRLVRHRWWPTFAAVVVAVIMLFVVELIVGLIFSGIESGLGVNSTGPWLVLNALSTIIRNLITYPFIAAVISVLYIDLRVRKEGLDLELLARGPGAPIGE